MGLESCGNPTSNFLKETVPSSVLLVFRPKWDTISWSWRLQRPWIPVFGVGTSASRNSIPSRNFQLGISAPFSGWNFRLRISELKFRAEIFLSRNFQLGKGAEIPSWKFFESKFSAWKRSWNSGKSKIMSRKFSLLPGPTVYLVSGGGRHCRPLDGSLGH